MVLAVPSMPLYATAAVPATLPACAACARNPPWACNFVLITSNGHVTTPEVNPPTAPAMALNAASERPMAILSSTEEGASGAARPDRGGADGLEVEGAYVCGPACEVPPRDCDISMRPLFSGRPRWSRAAGYADRLRKELSSLALSERVSRCAGRLSPTQHARDTETNGYRRPLAPDAAARR